MASSRTLNILIEAKNNANKELDTLKGKVKNLQPAFRKMAAVGTAAFAGISIAVGKTVQDAGKAEKIADNFESTFGKSTGTINDFITDFGDKFAFVESEMMSGANSIGFQLNAMGDIGKKEGEKITESLLTASAGLSDFFGEEMNVKDAANAMAKGLAGNRAQLMDMGFNVRVEDIKDMAESLGMNTDELTKAQEAQAFTKLIMEQTSGSVKGLKENLDSYTSRQRAMKKSTKEASETLGALFLPIITDLLEKITPVIEKIGNWIEENPKLAKNIIIAAGALAGLVAVVGLLGMLLPTIITGFTLLMGPVGLVIAIIAALAAIVFVVIKNWEGISAFFVGLWQDISSGVSNAWNSIKDFLSNIWKTISKVATNIWNGIMDFFKTAWETIKNIFKFALGFVLGLVISIFELMGIDIVQVFKNIIEWITTAWGNIKTLFTNSLNTIKETWRIMWTGIANFLTPIWNTIKEGIGSAWNWITDLFKKATKPLKEAWQGLWTGIKNTVIDIWDGIKNVIKGGINWVIDKLNWFIDKANQIAQKGNVMPGVNVPMISNIPKLAEGGIVKKPTLAMVGEAGPEAVMPLKDKDKINGKTINITINGDVSGEEVIDKVKQGIMSDLQFNGGLGA